ncbi:hypothetical protein [Nocardia sp. NPDC057030]|uniref:hypothetical protein n=1 Tax=unclassified Nocardia TaxID=2637762 RepID=UPI0036387E3D
MSDGESPVAPEPVLYPEFDLSANDDWSEGDDWFEGDGAARALNGIHGMICGGAEAYPMFAANLARADEYPLRLDQFRPIWDELQYRIAGPSPDNSPAACLLFLVLALLGVDHPDWTQDTRFAVAYVVFKLSAALEGYGPMFQFRELVCEVEREKAEFVVRVR